jgi:DNA-binding transcriptional regulator YhcF (GntR family)
MPKNSSQDFVAWLEAQLEKQEPGWRFPTDKQLAQEFGITDRSIRKAFVKYQRDGRVNRIRGVGTFIPKDTVEEKDIPSPQSTHERIADAIFESICRGEYKSGKALPSVNFLSMHFHVAPAAVTKAYRTLAQKGHIRKIGRNYWVGTMGGITAMRPSKEILFFNYESDDVSRIFSDDFFPLVDTSMEKELLSHGFIPRFENSTNMASLFRTALEQRKIPYGIVLLRQEEKRLETIKQTLTDFLYQAKRRENRRPPVLIDWRRGQAQTAPRGTTLLGRGHILTTAARSLARYAVDNGIKEVNYVLDSDKSTWCCFKGISTLLRIKRELDALNEDLTFRGIVKNVKTFPDVGALWEFMTKRLFSRGAWDIPDKRDILKKSLFVNPDFITALSRHSRGNLWVFSSDRDAAEAIAWARNHGLKIPDDMVVVGLENDPKSRYQGITHIGPDWDTIGYLMAHVLIGDFPIIKSKRGFIETPVMVLERFTSQAG